MTQFWDKLGSWGGVQMTMRRVEGGVEKYCMNHQINLMYINFHCHSNMTHTYIATPATDATPVASVITLIDSYSHYYINTILNSSWTNTSTFIHTTYICTRIL